MHLVELFVTHSTTMQHMYNAIFTETETSERKYASSKLSRQSSADMLIRGFLRDHPLEEDFNLDKKLTSIHSVVSTQSDTDMRTIQDNRSVYNAS